MAKIPPGWTEDQLRNATTADVQMIPLQDCLELNIMLIANEEARQLAMTRYLEAANAKLEAQQQANRIRRELPTNPPEQRNVDPLVEVIERQRLNEFGFLFFRLDYSDDARWATWEKACDDAIQDSLGTVEGIEHITDKKMNNVMVKDSILIGKTVRDVYSLYPNCYAAGYVTEGLSLSMCMAVDKEALNSLLNPIADQDPWVWAVDLSFDPDQHHVVGAQYPGYFKVAIASLLPDLYPMLAGARMLPSELWPSATPIWKSAF